MRKPLRSPSAASPLVLSSSELLASISHVSLATCSSSSARSELFYVLQQRSLSVKNDISKSYLNSEKILRRKAILESLFVIM